MSFMLMLDSSNLCNKNKNAFSMIEIIPGLFLSNFPDAEGNVSDNTLVINCTPHLPPLSKHFIRLPVLDNLDPKEVEKARSLIPGILPRMHQWLESQSGPVLVHCQAGQQRSPAVVASYLVKYHNMSVQESIDFVKSKKKDAFFWEARFRDAIFQKC